jgi:hypothetical protein
MPTVHQPPDSTTGPLPPPEVTPYFRRCAEVDAAVRLEAAARGLLPDPLAA